MTGVSIIIMYGSSYLVGERTPGKTWPNKLQFPGGRVEDEEYFIKAATRETVEECGFAPFQAKFRNLGTVRCRWPHGGLITVQALSYHCSPVDVRMISNKEPKKNKYWTWMSKDTLKQNAEMFRRPDQLIIERFL